VPLRDHFEKARRDILVDVIKDLNDKNLLILRAALADRDSYVKMSMKTIAGSAPNIMKRPYSYVYFYANLSYLQSLGLILLVSTNSVEPIPTGSS